MPFDPGSLPDAKRRLRSAMSERLRTRAPRDPSRAAELAARALERCSELAHCRAIVLYASLPDELPSRPFLRVALRAGREAFFPRMVEGGELQMVPCSQWEELAPGRYGVPEPPADRPGRALTAGDLVLLPGLAFDAAGHRLGRGGGYWDRSIPPARPEGLVLIGVGFACQQVESVPHGPHDRRVDAVLTEAGLERVEALGAA
jgi:5-formyltetrahydrofolate cyclo-ligase